jgi:hypothetical protein
VSRLGSRLRLKGKGREGKGREGKGRGGKGREGKGREGKGREFQKKNPQEDSVLISVQCIMHKEIFLKDKYC